MEFKVRRRAPVKFPLRFGWTMVTSRSWMVKSNRSMNIARRLGCNYIPLGYATRCVLSTSRRGGLSSPNVCARFSRAKFPLVGDEENKWSCFWGLVILLLSDQRPFRSTVYLPSRCRAPCVGRRRWRLSRCRLPPRRVFFHFSFVSFFGEKILCCFFKEDDFYFIGYCWICL